MKYLVSYYQDEYTLIHETEIECNENEIRDKTNKYYEENLQHLEVAGAKWREIIL